MTALVPAVALWIGCAGRGGGTDAPPDAAAAPGSASPSAEPAAVAGARADGTAGPEVPAPGVELLNATLWMQRSAEYAAVSRQTYRAAAGALDEALADSSWTALPSQAREGGYHGLPPAVILDVDETVLDNSPFQARLVLQGREFDPEIWGEWVREARAEPVPGALRFAREADRRGVAVFYVTNRDHALEPPTRRNLEELGFPLVEGEDRILTVGERPEWGSDKVDRRAAVAAGHRVLLVMGDDLNDFLPEARGSLEERDGAAARHQGRWGRQWFVLPNPAYGSWERAAYGSRGDLPPAEKRRLKREALEPRREGDPPE